MEFLVIGGALLMCAAVAWLAWLAHTPEVRMAESLYTPLVKTTFRGEFRFLRSEVYEGEGEPTKVWFRELSFQPWTEYRLTEDGYIARNGEPLNWSCCDEVQHLRDNAKRRADAADVWSDDE